MTAYIFHLKKDFDLTFEDFASDHGVCSELLVVVQFLKQIAIHLIPTMSTY